MAIKLAEQAAAAGHEVDGLDDAVREAMMAAGAAVLTNPRLSSSSEPKPENAFDSTIAAHVAKAAENAAESARNPAQKGDRSADAVMEAWRFATAAAESADATDLADALKEDFAKLHRVAVRGHWTDQTCVPSEIWSIL